MKRHARTAVRLHRSRVGRRETIGEPADQLPGVDLALHPVCRGGMEPLLPHLLHSAHHFPRRRKRGELPLHKALSRQASALPLFSSNHQSSGKASPRLPRLRSGRRTRHPPNSVRSSRRPGLKELHRSRPDSRDRNPCYLYPIREAWGWACSRALCQPARFS